MRTPVIAGLILLLAAPSLDGADSGPWNLEALKQAPEVTWLDKSGAVRKLYYQSEPLGGKPTRVFAYLAEPEKAAGRSPAMVLVHGGGGTAFKEWAELWAQRGYIALAMDLGGCGQDRKRLPDGGPAQDDASKFPRGMKPLNEIWTYHTVAAVIRGVSLLQSLPNVDKDKIGITGISWGGYLTCIVMGLDDRLKVAVPVYGCGYLFHNSVWLPTFEKLPSAWRKEWVRNFDPSQYVDQAKMPVLFVNGTNDFAYPLDSYQKTYRLVKERTLCVTVNMPHGHREGWAPAEIGLFVDQHLKNGKALPKIERVSSARLQGEIPAVAITARGDEGIKKAHLHWTTDTQMPWQKRKWQTRDAAEVRKEGRQWFEATLPNERPLVWFMTATDDRQATVSTEHQILDK